MDEEDSENDSARADARKTRRQTKISWADRANISIAVALSIVGDSSGGGCDCWMLPPPLADKDGSADDEDDDDTDDGDSEDGRIDGGACAQITCRMRDGSDSVATISSAAMKLEAL